ncbi:MAG: hypothetical protein R6W99_03075 [Clostridia bacterium]
MIKNEKGNALILVIIIMVVLVALAPALVLAANTEIKQATRYENRTQAYYYARSGIENALEWLIDGYQLNADYDGEDYIAGSMAALAKYDTAQGSTSEINVSVQTMNANEIKIVSTGIYNGVPMELSLVVNTVMISSNAFLVSDFDKAIFITDSGDLQYLYLSSPNGIRNIEGDIGLMVDYYNMDVFDFNYDSRYWDSSNKIYLYLPAGITIEQLEAELETYTETQGNKTYYTGIASFYFADMVVVVTGEVIAYPRPIFPTYPINTSTSVETDATIDFASNAADRFYDALNGNLTVYLNAAGDNNIYVNNLNIGSLVIYNTYDWENHDGTTQPYKLNIYVYDSLNLNGNDTLNQDGGVGDLMVYYKGETDIKFNGTLSINGSIFLETADYESLGNNGFAGHIIIGSGDATVTGNSDLAARVLYAPDSSVYMTGSETLKGSVVAKSVKCQGNGSVKYDETIDLVTFPWEIFDDPTGGSGGNESLSKRVLGYYWQ